jgi:hypothetical protein
MREARELLVNYFGNVQFEAETRGHKLICDQPFGAKGDDEGMTPPELLLELPGLTDPHHMEGVRGRSKSASSRIAVSGSRDRG